MLKWLFKRREESVSATKIYAQIVKQSRLPIFYTDLGVEDTFEGRFNLLSHHAFFVMRELSSGDAATQKVSQEVFDVMFEDFTVALREESIGDTGVSKRIKKLAQAFYGRAKAFDDVLTDGSEEAFSGHVLRNLYTENSEALDPDVGDRAVRYTRSLIESLKSQDHADITMGEISFPDL